MGLVSGAKVPLHHDLVGSVGAQGQKGATDEPSEKGVRFV